MTMRIHPPGRNPVEQPAAMRPVYVTPASHGLGLGARMGASPTGFGVTARGWHRNRLGIQLDVSRYDFRLAGAPYRWGDYAVAEKIDHADAMTLEEAEHQIATRLYQNTAKVHFNLHEQAQGQFKRRLVYGGVVISLARALSFNGLANAFHIAGINAGRHVAPCFGGDTIYAWSEVLDKAELPGRRDVGALRTRLVIVDDRKSEQAIRTDLVENLKRRGDYVVVNYWRQAVGQQGGGHISPLAAYDPESDSLLVLDVNPASAGWVWMPTSTLIKGMRTFDKVENRGYIHVESR
jgi:acyl dehydratase